MTALIGASTTTPSATPAAEVIRARPAGFLHDLASIAGRALRAVPRDPEAVLPGEADGGDHVVRRPGHCDGRGVLVHGQVPGPPGIVPAWVAGGEEGQRPNGLGDTHRLLLETV